MLGGCYRTIGSGSGAAASRGGDRARCPSSARGLPTTSERAPGGRVSVAGRMVAGVFVVVLYSRQEPGVISDWDPRGPAARALLEGKSPYAAMQMPPWP